jgi:hypothetical protein
VADPPAQPSTTVTGSPPATSRTISDLTAGTAYTFTVQASNISGYGLESDASNSVTPQGPDAPAAPTGVSAAGDTTSAVVRWTAPSNDGGSAITGYTVTPYLGAAAQTAFQVGASTTTTRVTGLANGTSYTFKVAATNAIGTGTASAASDAVTPRSSILELATPGTADSGDTDPVVVGVKFQADVAGTVTGVRFYKAATNTGTHVGTLWSAGGSVLGQGTFTGESASGWQTVTFATPVTVTAGTTYIAAYLAPNGHYATTPAGFAGGIDNAPLHALADGSSSNGVFAYSSTPVFPTGSWNATNYWVDVLFAEGS